MRLLIVYIILIVLLVGCGNNDPRPREYRFYELSYSSLNGVSYRIVVDGETDCQYLIVAGADPIPVNDEQGKPIKGCKGVLK